MSWSGEIAILVTCSRKPPPAHGRNVGALSKVVSLDTSSEDHTHTHTAYSTKALFTVLIIILEFTSESLQHALSAKYPSLIVA